VVQARLGEHVEHASGGTRLWVVRSEHHPRHAREHDCAGAHRAGLERHVENGVEQAPAPELGGRFAHREQLGVGGGIAAELALVEGGGQHLAAGDHDGSDWDVVVLDGALRLAQREPHEVLVAGEEGRLRHSPTTPATASESADGRRPPSTRSISSRYQSTHMLRNFDAYVFVGGFVHSAAHRNQCQFACLPSPFWS
jgi:hypothetical protein